MLRRSRAPDVTLMRFMLLRIAVAALMKDVLSEATVVPVVAWPPPDMSRVKREVVPAGRPTTSVWKMPFVAVAVSVESVWLTVAVLTCVRPAIVVVPEAALMNRALSQEEPLRSPPMPAC